MELTEKTTAEAVGSNMESQDDEMRLPGTTQCRRSLAVQLPTLTTGSVPKAHPLHFLAGIAGTNRLAHRYKVNSMEIAVAFCTLFVNFA
ncbi:hypothetical protein [Shewanella zhuhaiensis]|uniref:hypothetical protein n=1 Tax=Shewanella zhuhaiensis TaxID=2919576 RepID=UPI001F0BB702|nr:hypothetical protein [Shewanella zhuhaiensis]